MYLYPTRTAGSLVPDVANGWALRPMFPCIEALRDVRVGNSVLFPQWQA